MTPRDDTDGVLYEVNLEADAAIEAAFDTWLRDHVADMLQLPGFRSAEILSDPAAPSGRVRRSVQYRLRDQAALDAYVREQAPRMRAVGEAKFGDRFTAQRRVLAHREEFVRGKVSTENCLNCGEVLTGQHCSHCGQHAAARVLSLGGLLRDLIDDLVNFDSRLWRTLRPLAFKPGELTLQYLRGRRMHYTPPIRMYLIVSVAFFVLASVGADPGSAIHFDPTADEPSVRIGPDVEKSRDAQDTQATAAKTPPPAAKLDAGRQRLLEAVISKMPEKDRARARAELAGDLGRMKPADVATMQRVVDDPCGEKSLHIDNGALLKKYEPSLRGACRKIVADNKGFGRAVYENIPKMMFIFLPLMSAMMYVLYLGSGRYYVEHLLFFVHFHAFFFFSGLLVVCLERGANLLGTGPVAGGLRVAGGLLVAALAFYVPYYLYAAMRRVYGQGRLLTLAKFCVLGVGYLVCLSLTAVGLLAYTALTL
ncbi:MAG TPA: DUF4286 family protein [Steroidobacteraceae bacterium]|nr:DUF4286 family protein [Steroidobacteraceae bacterium]